MSLRPMVTKIWNFDCRVLSPCTIPWGKRWIFSETTQKWFLTLFHMSLYLKKLYKHWFKVNGIPAYTLSWCDKCTTNVRQYVRKLETQQANRRINKHRNDVNRPDAIAIDKHFREAGHSFDDFRMIVIEEIGDKNMTKEQVRQTLLRREDFWVKTLGTLEPQGFNERLNFPSHA